MPKKIQIILGIIIATISIVGSIFAASNYVAKDSDLTILKENVAMSIDLEQVAMRLEQKIVEDRAEDIQRRLWNLQDRFQNIKIPQVVKEEMRLLKDKYEKLIKKLDDTQI